jgi:hypothetical protein
MRMGFPQMLVASFVLHLGLAAGLSLAYLHSVAPTDSITTASQPDSPALILLRSVETPDFHPVTPTTPAQPPSNPLATQAPAALPAPEQPVVEKKISTPPPPSFALEANPNAQVRPLPPEAVLSPNPAPHLDGKDGVVFILDVSGSMYEAYAGSTRLAFARQTLANRIRALKNGTPFAITVYAETALTSGPLVAANDATRDAAVRFIMRDIDCGGGTNLPAGLASATRLQTGSLVLISDGDLHIAQFALKAEAARILGRPGQGPALTVIGIYPRLNHQDGHLLQSLADEQGGSYHAERFDGTELVTAGALKTEIGTP